MNRAGSWRHRFQHLTGCEDVGDIITEVAPGCGHGAPEDSCVECWWDHFLHYPLPEPYLSDPDGPDGPW